jgi:hypothetical protein
MPGYPFRPHGKERGDHTLARSLATGIFPIRPLPPPAGGDGPQAATHNGLETGKVIRQANFTKTDSLNLLYLIVLSRIPGGKVGSHFS